MISPMNRIKLNVHGGLLMNIECMYELVVRMWLLVYSLRVNKIIHKFIKMESWIWMTFHLYIRIQI
ncbi:hypothetical protein Lalb_Chr17g0339361 [Lupinus albus]|uniref:Uncharacterized protein n=1 Tax=Lupinus albus TaxID=3870 RepID=A0A6A4P1M5_LUPAL|nr:hypothetical protein Lalb_Chr17g0339361 [Lupinus albus]